MENSELAYELSEIKRYFCENQGAIVGLMDEMSKLIARVDLILDGKVLNAERTEILGSTDSNP